MKLVFNFAAVISLCLSVSVSSYADQNSPDAFLTVSKQMRGTRSTYSFSVCDSKNNECLRLGRETGYFYGNIVGLSGNMQKFVGVPVLLIGETVGGVVVAFAVGATVVPSATAGTAATILWGGAATGGIAPSLAGQASKLRAISPAYHWNKGSTKVDIERAVRALNKDKGASSAILYHSKNFDSIENFYEAVEIAERILSDL